MSPSLRARIVRPLTLFVALLVVLAPAAALADDVPPVVWRSMIDQQIRVVLDSGLEVTGTLAGYEETAAVLVKSDGTVVTVDPRTAKTLQVVKPVSAPPPPTAPPAAAPAPPAPGPPAGGIPIMVHELPNLVGHTRQFRQRVDASGYSPETREKLKSLQSRWKRFDAISDAFIYGGAGVALGGIVPFVFGITSIDDDDGIVPKFEAPAVTAVGAGLLGTGLGIMLGPGLGFSSATGSAYRGIESVLLSPENAARPPTLGVVTGPGGVFVTATWQLGAR